MRQDPPAGPRGLPAEDHERGPHRRQQHPRAREAELPSYEDDAEADEGEPEHREDVREPAHPCRAPRVRSGGTRKPPAEPGMGDRRQGSDRELPETHLGQVELLGDGGAHAVGVEEEGASRQEHDDRQKPDPRPSRKPDHEGPDEVELLLDPEGPDVEQRLRGRVRVKVAGLPRRHQVEAEPHARHDVPAERHEGAGKEHLEPDRVARREDHHQAREDAPYPPSVEGGDHTDSAPARVPEAFEEDRRDQEAGDHEEHVDAYESAPHPSGECVEADHKEDRDGAQPVDGGTVPASSGRGSWGIAVHQRSGLAFVSFMGGAGQKSCHASTTVPVK